MGWQEQQVFEDLGQWEAHRVSVILTGFQSTGEVRESRPMSMEEREGGPDFKLIDRPSQIIFLLINAWILQWWCVAISVMHFLRGEATGSPWIKRDRVDSSMGRSTVGVGGREGRPYVNSDNMQQFHHTYPQKFWRALNDFLYNVFPLDWKNKNHTWNQCVTTSS